MTQQPAETAETPHADGVHVAPPPTSAPDAGAPGNDEEQDESVKEVFARLYSDGRAYASAEAERQKLRVGIIGTAVRNAAIFVIVALMLVFATIVAFLIGLIIALSPQLGPLWATFAVLGASLLVALILLLLAKNAITGMLKALKP